MHKIKLKVDYKQEPKVEKLLDLLNIKSFEKYTTFFCDRVFEITATQKQTMQLQELLTIIF